MRIDDLVRLGFPQTRLDHGQDGFTHAIWTPGGDLHGLFDTPTGRFFYAGPEPVEVDEADRKKQLEKALKGSKAAAGGTAKPRTGGRKRKKKSEAEKAAARTKKAEAKAKKALEAAGKAEDA